MQTKSVNIIGFPSIEALQRDFDLVFGNSPLKPTVPYASDIFHQIGSKGVSFGRILAIGPGVLAHNCSLLNGASGSRFFYLLFLLSLITLTQVS